MAWLRFITLCGIVNNNRGSTRQAPKPKEQTKIIRLIDNNKAVEISIRAWDDESSQYGSDWAADFFEVGFLKPVEGEESTYVVDDVDYCIEYANDMVTGEGDFAGEPQPNQLVDVTELDRSAYPANL